MQLSYNVLVWTSPSWNKLNSFLIDRLPFWHTCREECLQQFTSDQIWSFSKAVELERKLKNILGIAQCPMVYRVTIIGKCFGVREIGTMNRRVAQFWFGKEAYFGFPSAKRRMQAQSNMTVIMKTNKREQNINIFLRRWMWWFAFINLWL